MNLKLQKKKGLKENEFKENTQKNDVKNVINSFVKIVGI